MWTSNTAWIIPVCGSNHIWRNILIIIWFPGRVKWVVRGLPMIPLTPLLLPLHPGHCVQLQRTSWKLHNLQNAPEDLKNFWYTSKHTCKAHHCTHYSYILFCEGFMLSLAGLYGDHFYISMKGHAILGPPLGPHKLSHIYAFPLEAVWWRTVEPLQSNGQKNICCRRGSHCLMWNICLIWTPCSQAVLIFLANWKSTQPM